MRLTPGKYHVRVVKAFATEAQSGTPGITFMFECESGEIDCTRWITDKTRDYVIKDLDTLGFSFDMLGDQENLDRIDDIVRGNEVEIVVADEEYRGTVEAKVKWINAVGSRGGGNTKASVWEALTGKTPAVSAVARKDGLVSGPRSVPVASQQPFAPVSDQDVPY